MKESRRTLLVLLAIFAALAVLTIVQNQQEAQPSAWDDVVFMRVYPQIETVEDVRAVRLQDPSTGQTLTVTQEEDGTWSSADGEVDANTGTQIATTIALLPYRRSLPLAPNDDLAAYGFTPNGVLQVQLLLEDGTGHAVAIGSLTAAQTHYYAIVDNRESVYLLERSPVDFLIVQLRDLTVS